MEKIVEENFVIKKIKNGDSSSFKILYEKYQSKLFAYVYCKVSDKAEVEDLMQEVFVKVYKNIELYDESKSSFYNFILTNAKQVISDYFRNNNNYENRIEKIYLNSNVISDEDIAIIYDSIDGEYNLKSVLDKLPETQRMALNLVYIKNMSYKDAARIMKKSELSVKSLIFRAKRTLKKDIAEKYPEIVKEYGFKKVAKAVVISTVCFGLIGGFSYAAFKVYMDKFYKGTYTVADVKSEISDDKAIDKEKAKDIKEEFALAHKRMAISAETINIKNKEEKNISINQYEVSEVVESRLKEILNLAKKQINHNNTIMVRTHHNSVSAPLKQ